ncbi:sporulation protein YqfD [Virgibacillus sp. YIM 98842]|uniref:sporulation protein YqfD n=1 Tax=Virgibacillus sp. YIM 98842 TaxID=2663533 RepID=UPI0013DB3020|nr:sporulation protein YqfD [Virgibacillus sp. YIM 98842]
MKQIQGSFFTGYVTIAVKGNQPELFFQLCAQKGISVWDVKKTADNQCQGNVKLNDVNEIKYIRKNTGYKIRFMNKKGFPFHLSRFLQRKELLTAAILSIMLVLFLSNIIWEVKVTGVPKDIEEKITKQLDSYGIHSGAWKFSIDSPKEIQKMLVEDIPELLWVGVDQKGTTYFLEGVEKVIVEEEEAEGPRHLVATKKGVIKNMYVTEGIPQVSVNDYVEPGDILVSGIINGEEETGEDEDGENNKELEYVAAEGEITATTWYEAEVTIPLQFNTERITGNHEKKYYIRIGNMQLPVWGFSEPDYNAIHREADERPINFFKWELPVAFVEMTLSELLHEEKERTKEEAVNIGVEQAKNELSLQLGPDAEIISEKVLHETTDSGKVKVNLYINAEEDIAQIQPLNQGD